MRPPEQEKAPQAGTNGAGGQANGMTTTAKRPRALMSISQGLTLRGSPMGIELAGHDQRPTSREILHAPLGNHVSTSTLGTR